MAALLLWGCYTQVEADRNEPSRKRRPAAPSLITPGSFVDSGANMFSQSMVPDVAVESDEHEQHEQHGEHLSDHEQEGHDGEVPELEVSQNNQLLELSDTVAEDSTVTGQPEWNDNDENWTPDELNYKDTKKQLENLTEDVKAYDTKATAFGENSEHAIKWSQTYAEGVKKLKEGVERQRKEAEQLPEAVQNEQNAHITKIQG
eukprot:CAMPEP_0115378878 /NCGR_PEP_ID=MMETSP0271-20121206/4242_1 /TAXON_ID=71861 /ORGANISM="Scrippsiella trochoidea, Strain CCMP3099" /LENGTH=202 /DNA_ID=CAMNT_0002802061 /DNA_START=148 /DNA_END=753 /DNA_ORIENTATION=+